MHNILSKQTCQSENKFSLHSTALFFILNLDKSFCFFIENRIRRKENRIPDRQMSQGTRSLVRSRGLWRVEGPASDDNNFRSDADPGWSGCASAQRTADGHAVTASRRAANGFPRRKHESAARENGVSILRLRIPPLLSC